LKTPLVAATIVFAATALAATSVAQNHSMPGMDMPAGPTPKTAPAHRHPAPEKKSTSPAQKTSPTQKGDQSMPEMDMSQHEGQSGQPPKGTGRQNMQGMHMDSPMSQAPQNGSVTHDTINLQEPENPSHNTGSNLPAPDLLKEVAPRQPIALLEFLKAADETNPTLAQANAFVHRSAAQARQAGLYPNPSAGYQGEQIRGGSYGGGEQGAYVQQTIVLGGKLGLRKDIYNRQKQSDQIGVEEQTYRVHNDVTEAFYTALTSQATVIVRQRLVGVALDAVETAHQLANVGQADSPDILQAEVEAEQAKIDFLTAQRQFLQNFRTLAALSGRQDLAVSPLAGSIEDLPELDTEQLVGSIVRSSPTVKRRQEEVAVGEARLREARREPVPDLTLRAGEQYNFEHVIDTPSRAAGPQTFAQAGITIPLWNRNQGNVDAAQAEIERAMQDVVRTQLSLRQTAEPLAQSYLSSRFTADRYRTELIPRAQRAYQLYLTKYQSMAMAYPQVLVSQRTLFELQIGYLTALHDVWTNVIALQNYTLTGGLDAPMSTGSSSTSINLPNSSAGSPE